MSSFFNYNIELYEYFKNVNIDLEESTGFYFVNPVLLNTFDSKIRTDIKKFSEDPLKSFVKHFNDFFDYDRFKEKDIPFFKNLFRENIDNIQLPGFIRNNLVSNVNDVFDNEILEEKNITEFQTLIFKCIKEGMKECNFTPKDKRWLEEDQKLI